MHQMVAEHGLRGYPVPLDAIDEQIRREMDFVDRGVQRYRESLVRKKKDGTTQGVEVGETKPGMRIIQEVMETLVPAIAAVQEEAAEALANPKPGKPAVFWYIIQFLSPEQLAFITIRTALTERIAPPNNRTRPVSAISRETTTTRAAISIANVVKLQMEWEAYKKKSRDAAKEGLAKDVAAALQARAKQLNPKLVRRWQAKLDGFERFSWTHEEKLNVGMVLLDLLVRHGRGWFELDYVVAAGRNYRVLQLTPAAIEYLTQETEALAYARPVLMPMIVPPKPWRLVTEL